MNIWEWVTETERRLKDEGQNRLAEIMDRIPSLTCNDRHEEVEALLPEGVALSKQLGLPWVELFLRHWHMQSAILHQYDVKDRLGQAIDLLEFAHQEQNKACPQSVCTTQDVAVAYGLLDGKGYAQERIDVSLETLSKINPTWPCYGCIATEYTSALIDQGKLDETLAFLDKTLEQLKDGKQYRNLFPDMAGSYVDALILRQAPGDLERALELNAEALKLSHSNHRIVVRQLDQARVLARLGRAKEAIEIFPPWETIWNTPAHYSPAADALYVLIAQYLDDAEQGMPNSWRAGRMLTLMAMELQRRGVARKGAEIAIKSAKLALARRRPTLTKLLIELAHKAAQDLRDPTDFDVELTALRDKLAALRAQVPEPDVQLDEEDDLQELLSEDPELSLEFLEHVISERADVVREHARALEALGFGARAIERLERALQAQPDAPDPQLITALESAYRQAKRPQEQRRFLEALAIDERLPTHTRGLCYWLLSHQSRDQQDWHDALAQLAHAERLDPTQPSLRPYKATLLMQLDRLEDALAVLDQHIESDAGQDSGPWDWDRMSLAALLGRWDKVRASALRIGWELPQNNEPIHEEFGLCRIVFSKELDQPTYWAERISPVTARILSMAAPDHIQHLNDVVVFDAEPLNPKPQDHPEGEPYYYHYRSMGVIEAGQYQQSICIDGVYPGDEAIEELEARLEGLGAQLRVLSGESYELTPDGEAGSMRGLYAYIALEDSASPLQLHRLLTEYTTAQAHPLFWTGLLRQLQLFEERDQQREQMKRYGVHED